MFYSGDFDKLCWTLVCITWLIREVSIQADVHERGCNPSWSKMSKKKMELVWRRHSSEKDLWKRMLTSYLQYKHNLTSINVHADACIIKCWAILPALVMDRLQREPPQVKMTARINSRPHSFTPYDGPSYALTSASSIHTASTVAFNIMKKLDKV